VFDVFSSALILSGQALQPVLKNLVPTIARIYSWEPSLTWSNFQTSNVLWSSKYSELVTSHALGSVS